MITGPDLSHHQASPDFAAIKAAGNSFVVLKATEGTGYTDLTFAARRVAARKAGLIVGLYHFARAGSVTAEAAYFTRTVGTLAPGEFVVLDWEVPAPAGTTAPAWCKTWLDAVRGSLGVAPLIYMNQSAAAGSNWSLVARLYGLWLARYDNAPTAENAVPHWGVPAMKQYTDRGTMPGVPGTCDINSFFGTTAQLLAYAKGGTAPAPAPKTVREDDMRVLRDPNGTVWLATETSVSAISDQTLSTAAQKVWSGIIDCTAAEIAALAADANARRNSLLTDVQRSVLCATPSDRTGAWLWDRIAGVDDKTGAIADDVQAVGDAVGKVQTPVVDAAKLAAALLADDAAVTKLGEAIAAGLASRVHNG